MNMRALISSGIFVAVVVMLALCLPGPAFAASTVTISPAGDGVFLLQGVGIEDAAAFEITVVYDTTTLSNPRVTGGPLVAGAMTAINPNVPGTVRIVIIRLSPVKGSGVIATMTFDRTGPSPGRINALSARLATITGAPMLAQVQVTNPPDSSMSTSTASQDQGTPAASPTTAGISGTPSTPSTVPPTIIIAGPPARTDEIKSAPDAPRTREQDVQAPMPDTTNLPGKEPVTVARKTDSVVDAKDASALATTMTRTIYTQKSILKRFQEYRGQRTAEALISLFDQESMIGCRQDPPIALSDGRTVVRVSFISTPGNMTSSDVAVMGARLLSLRRDPDNTNTWIAELLPEKGTCEASLTVSLGELKMIYPLTVAPKVDAAPSQSGNMAGADRDGSLNRRGTSRPATADLNRDGQWDYRDDYILTANYLAGLKKE
jgi:hypothetical protein